MSCAGYYKILQNKREFRVSNLDSDLPAIVWNMKGGGLLIEGERWRVNVEWIKGGSPSEYKLFSWNIKKYELSRLFMEDIIVDEVKVMDKLAIQCESMLHKMAIVDLVTLAFYLDQTGHNCPYLALK